MSKFIRITKEEEDAFKVKGLSYEILERSKIYWNSKKVILSFIERLKKLKFIAK